MPWIVFSWFSSSSIIVKSFAFCVKGLLACIYWIMTAVNFSSIESFCSSNILMLRSWRSHPEVSTDFSEDADWHSAFSFRALHRHAEMFSWVIAFNAFSWTFSDMVTVHELWTPYARTIGCYGFMHDRQSTFSTIVTRHAVKVGRPAKCALQLTTRTVSENKTYLWNKKTLVFVAMHFTCLQRVVQRHGFIGERCRR